MSLSNDHHYQAFWDEMRRAKYFDPFFNTSNSRVEIKHVWSGEYWILPKNLCSIWIAKAFLSHFPPMKVSINDLQNGRAPIHYAATQQNAIYDTLVECGADAFLPDNVRLSSFSLLSYFFYNAVVLLVCVCEHTHTSSNVHRLQSVPEFRC